MALRAAWGGLMRAMGCGCQMGIWWGILAGRHAGFVGGFIWRLCPVLERQAVESKGKSGGNRDQNIPHFPFYPAGFAGYIELGVSMSTACPYCTEKTVTNTLLLRSASGVGLNPQCSACGARWSVSSKWQGNFAGLVILAFIFSAALSVKERSFLPYLIFPFAVAIASFLVCRYAKPFVVTPLPRWLSLLHYVVLIFFLVVLVHFFDP